MTQVDLDYIKDRRTQLKLSMRNVANQLGFKNASTYLKYENGVYAFKAEQLPLLASVLKCEIKDFFY
jgi:transcriptional regulator with XRE-family HTH domain